MEITPCTLAEKCGDTSLIVLGGTSRSGKSTLAHLLSRAYVRQGLAASVLHFDNYLGGEGYRLCRSKPLGYFPIEQELRLKFEYERIAEDISHLLSGKQIFQPVYDRGTTARVRERNEHPTLPADVLIVEGTPALAPSETEFFTGIRIYLVADEEKSALYQDWILTKNLSQEKADELYAFRNSREIPYIAQTKQSANMVIRRSKDSYVLQNSDS